MDFSQLFHGDEVAPNFHLFNFNALNALNRKTSHLIHQRNELKHPHISPFLHFMETLLGHKEHEDTHFIRVCDKVAFFGLVVDQQNKQQAMEVLINVFNQIADKNVITATLAPFTSMQLHNKDGEQPKIALFCYFAIDYKREQEITATYKDLFFDEATGPRSYEEISHAL
jgi:hypothetical protein